ncbi:MAG TPA: S1 RNA-binding domain-containing protein [Alphaproteobacteria bacterium]|nr:S1 RNA-binding domain-containing protein [Alphaproteobacteria bacterium]
MFIKRLGFPEESDLVICSVNNIQHNSIFVNIHEYDRQGMITISEIAPGRIRNIRDYVTEGKVIVCKVLYVNKERGYIDLSLRRVTEGQRRQKNDELKQELKAEKILEMTAHVLKLDVKALYDKAAKAFLNNYFYIYQAFDDFLAGSISLADYFDKPIAEQLEKTIREKIKPKEILVAGDVTINSWEENGVEDIKKAFSQVTQDNMTISYLGGGKYRMLLKGTDYKVLEKLLKDVSDSVINYMKKHKAHVEYERVKNLSTETASA